jgi:hypothetical protein
MAPRCPGTPKTHRLWGHREIKLALFLYAMGSGVTIVYVHTGRSEGRLHSITEMENIRVLKSSQILNSSQIKFLFTQKY